MTSAPQASHRLAVGEFLVHVGRQGNQGADADDGDHAQGGQHAHGILNGNGIRIRSISNPLTSLTVYVLQVSLCRAGSTARMSLRRYWRRVHHYTNPAGWGS